MNRVAIEMTEYDGEKYLEILENLADVLIDDYKVGILICHILAAELTEFHKEGGYDLELYKSENNYSFLLKTLSNKIFEKNAKRSEQ